MYICMMYMHCINMYLRVELLSVDFLIIVEEDQLLRHLQLPLKATEYKRKYIQCTCSFHLCSLSFTCIWFKKLEYNFDYSYINNNICIYCILQ